jgi:hypothetical protein
MLSATIESRISLMVQEERIAKLEAENEQLREFLQDKQDRGTGDRGDQRPISDDSERCSRNAARRG